MKYLILAFVVIIVFGACDVKRATNSDKEMTEVLEGEINDSIRLAHSDYRGDSLMYEEFQSIFDCIINDDAEAFAGMVEYPIIRPYPLRWIKDSAQMVKYFHIIADDSLKQVCRTHRPEDWSEYGWRGYSFEQGEYLWWDGGIISITYMSPAEQKLIDKLKAEEVRSLHPSLRRVDISPVYCLEDNVTGAIYRLDYIKSADEDEDYKYRICVYNDKKKLAGKPDFVLKTLLEIVGSSAVEQYEGYCDGCRISFADDYHDKESEIAVTIRIDGKEKQHSCHRVYWRDIIGAAGKAVE